MERQKPVAGAVDGAGISKGRRRSIQGPPTEWPLKHVHFTSTIKHSLRVHYILGYPKTREKPRRFGYLSHGSRWMSGDLVAVQSMGETIRGQLLLTCSSNLGTESIRIPGSC